MTTETKNILIDNLQKILAANTMLITEIGNNVPWNEAKDLFAGTKKITNACSTLIEKIKQ